MPLFTHYQLPLLSFIVDFSLLKVKVSYFNCSRMLCMLSILNVPEKNLSRYFRKLVILRSVQPVRCSSSSGWQLVPYMHSNCRRQESLWQHILHCKEACGTIHARSKCFWSWLAQVSTSPHSLSVSLLLLKIRRLYDDFSDTSLKLTSFNGRNWISNVRTSSRSWKGWGEWRRDRVHEKQKGPKPPMLPLRFHMFPSLRDGGGYQSESFPC